MKKKLIEIVLNNRILFGVIFIILSITFAVYKIKKKGKSFEEHNLASWGAYVKGWSLIIILFIFGIFLILNKN